MPRNRTCLNRRQFVSQTLIGTGAIVCAPAVVTAQKTTTRKTIGSGDYVYQVDHAFARLPTKYHWQTTHNVALDGEGLLYVIHEGRSDLTDHPAIFVFDQSGQYVRSFGSQFQGGGHGIEVRREGSEEFLYVSAYQHLKMFSKLTLKGEEVWTRRAPMESQRYAEGEAQQPDGSWGRDRFMPTNIAFAADGSFYVADGYGAWCIHHYDQQANWKSVFGGVGSDDGQFSLPHGIWVDRREGDAKIVVADRQNHRLQWFNSEGEHLKTMDGFLLPANIDIHGELMLVPELQSRLTLLDGNNNVVARLGDDAAWREEVLADEMKLRSQPDRWQEGFFVHPHDACFDQEGNIFVAEWVATGRVSKLTRIG